MNESEPSWLWWVAVFVLLVVLAALFAALLAVSPEVGS